MLRHLFMPPWLGKCRFSKCSYSARDIKGGPAYGRKKNAIKSLLEGM